MPIRRLEINLDEKFDNLTNAPIVEAAIHWRAQPETPIDPNEFSSQLKERLEEYPAQQPLSRFEVGAEVSPGGSSVNIQQPVWQGFRHESEDGKQIAQFMKNGFVFSRLKPYEDWSQFAQEACRLWAVYQELAKPLEVESLGVRFINVIPLASLASLGEKLTNVPPSPSGMELPVSEFMHQTQYAIPGNPYKLNVIQTIQPQSPPQAGEFSLILDLDVITTSGFACDDGAVQERLLKMRWIKNKAFTSLLTEDALSEFKD